MASSLSSRGPLAAANRPTTITLDEWESRTPLAEAQLASISTVRQASDHRPLPDKVRVLVRPSWTAAAAAYQVLTVISGPLRRLAAAVLPRRLVLGLAAGLVDVRLALGLRPSLPSRHAPGRPQGSFVVAAAQRAFARLASAVTPDDALAAAPPGRRQRRRRRAPPRVVDPLARVPLAGTGAVHRDAPAVLRLVRDADGLARARAGRPLPRLPRRDCRLPRRVRRPRRRVRPGRRRLRRDGRELPLCRGAQQEPPGGVRGAAGRAGASAEGIHRARGREADHDTPPPPLARSQSRLLTISETLSQRLSYFASLEPATRMLNAPGAASQVTSADFIPMIERIDECLAYLQAHVRPSCARASFLERRASQLTPRFLTLLAARLQGLGAVHPALPAVPQPEHDDDPHSLCPNDQGARGRRWQAPVGAGPSPRPSSSFRASRP